MPDPTRPVQDLILDPAWGQWVHDNMAAPRRFRLWRNSAFALGVDGFNPITLDQKDDPYTLTQGSAFKAPVAGVVAFSATLVFSLTNAGSATCHASLFSTAGPTEIRRGDQHAVTSPTSVGSHVSGIVLVAAGDTIDLRGYAQGAGIAKSVFGNPAYCFFEGCYIGDGIG